MKNQGELVEIEYMYLAMKDKIVISKPFGDNQKYDLIEDNSGKLSRIQIKSTSRLETSNRNNCYSCNICSGANKKVKYTKNDVDFIVVKVIPFNAWYKIPIEVAIGKTVKLYPHVDGSKSKYEKYRIV